MFTLGWLIPNKVAYAHLFGEHTMQDIERANVDFNLLLEEAGQNVHLIMDMRDLERMPLSLASAQATLEVARHESLSWVVSVSSDNPIIKYMGIMIVKLFRLRFRRCETMQEVIDFLASVDPSIDWSLMDRSVLRDERLTLPAR
jgi:hypothetical protein